MAVQTHAVPLDDAALAWLALALVPELTPRRAFALVERFGTPRAVLEASPEALAAAGVTPAVAGEVARGGRACRRRRHARRLVRGRISGAPARDRRSAPRARRARGPARSRRLRHRG